MAYDPCDVCRERYVGAAVTGYHRWYAGSLRRAYKQKMCSKCAKLHFAEDVAHSVNTEDEEAQWPDSCYLCQVALDGDVEQTWTTWYRGKNKSNVAYITCVHCAGNLRTRLMAGAQTLEDREPPAAAAASAPLPNPPGFGGGRDGLPW